MDKGSPMTEKINVALLGATPPRSGGIASWTDRMLRTKEFSSIQMVLVDERLNPKRDVFGLKSKKRFVDEINRCKRIWKDLEKTIEESDIDIVHSNTPATITSLMREIVCAKIAKRKRCHFVAHFHCTVPVVVKSKIHRNVLKAFLSLSDVAIVLNVQSKQFLEQICNTPVYVIPNFVLDEECARPNGKRRVRRKISRVLYAGGITEEKGVYDILRVAHYCTDIEFRLAGAGLISKEVADIPNNVKLLGPLEKNELALEYEASDAFIFLSHFKSEGFSCALLEAMASGLPCVVTDWAANKEMIGDGGGIVVPCSDPEAVVSALQKIDDPLIRKDQSERNIRVVREKYSEKTVVGMYSDVYRTINN